MPSAAATAARSVRASFMLMTQRSVPIRATFASPLPSTSTVAVKSALQRARARLQQVAPSPEDVSEPTEPEARALPEAYISAFQNADPAELERVLSPALIVSSKYGTRSSTAVLFGAEGGVSFSERTVLPGGEIGPTVSLRFMLGG